MSEPRCDLFAMGPGDLGPVEDSGVQALDLDTVDSLLGLL